MCEIIEFINHESKVNKKTQTGRGLFINIPAFRFVLLCL